MSSQPASSGSQLRESITDAQRKIESIIDAAERAAADIRAEARKEAEAETRRHLAESTAKLGEITAPLQKRVESLRAEAKALTHDIEAAEARLRELSRPSGSDSEQPAPAASPPSSDKTQAAGQTSSFGKPAPAQPAPEPAPAPGPAASPASSAPVSAAAPAPQTGPRPVAYPGTGGGSAEPGGAPPEEAYLRATQMAVAGSPRAEIEETLRAEFGLDDPAPIVGEILGD